MIKLKILIVCSGNSGKISPFIREQADAIKELGHVVNYFTISGKGFIGYLNNYIPLRKAIKKYKPDLIHAHYGLSALLANFQRMVPVISTFHGSDVWVYRKNEYLSRFANLLSFHSIVVEATMLKQFKFKRKISVIACGVNTQRFYPINIDKTEIFRNPCIKQGKVNILFSSRFDYYEKNYPLAQATMNLLGDQFNLIELKGYSRAEVNFLMNTCDIVLMTSISEGSPQFIKEAMACNCPIVTTDVGDVRWVIGETEGCYICKFDPGDVAEKIGLALDFVKSKGRTNGRKRIIELGLDSESIAKSVVEIYKTLI